MVAEGGVGWGDVGATSNGFGVSLQSDKRGSKIDLWWLCHLPVMLNTVELYTLNG